MCSIKKKLILLVNKSGDALKEIISAVKQVNMFVPEMASASEEQRRGIEQINSAVIDMDTMTQQNAALVEETAASSEEMSGQAQEILAMVQRFNVGYAADKITEYKISEGNVREYLNPANRDAAKRATGKDKTLKSGSEQAKDIFEEEGFEKF